MSDPKKPIEGEIVPPDATTPVDDKTAANQNGADSAAGKKSPWSAPPSGPQGPTASANGNNQDTGTQTPGAGAGTPPGSNNNNDNNNDDERMPGAGGEGLSNAQKRKLGSNKILSGVLGAVGIAGLSVVIGVKAIGKVWSIATSKRTLGSLALAGTLPFFAAAVTEGIEELNNPHGNFVSYGIDTLNQSQKNYAWTSRKLNAVYQGAASIGSAPWKAGASLGSGTQQATRVAGGITAERIVYCEPVLPAHAGIYRALSPDQQVEILQKLRNKFNEDIATSGTAANNVLYDKKFPVIRGIVEGRQAEVIKLDVIHAESAAAQNCAPHLYRAMGVPDDRKLPRVTTADLK